MSDIFLHLHSVMPAVFCINGEQVGSIQNPTQYIALSVCQEQFILYVYPLITIHDSFCSLSYSVKINCSARKPFCDNDLITITDYGQNHFVLCADDLKVPRINSHKSHTCASGDCRISILNNQIFAATPRHNFTFTPNHDIIDAKLDKFNDFYALFTETAEQKNYLILLNKNLQMIFDCAADKIEILDNHIITLTKINDIARHGIVHDYSIQGEEIKLTKNYTVYTQNSPVVPANMYAVPFAFLEAVSIKNFTLARTYLHPALSQSLSNDQMSHFFGNFIEANTTFDAPPNVLALIYPGKPRFVKKYYFELNDNRIINIDSVE